MTPFTFAAEPVTAVAAFKLYDPGKPLISVTRSSKSKVTSLTIAVIVLLTAIFPSTTASDTRAAITSLSALSSLRLPVTNSTPSAPSIATPALVMLRRFVSSLASNTATLVASATLNVRRFEVSPPAMLLLVSVRRLAMEVSATVAVMTPVVLSSISLN